MIRVVAARMPNDTPHRGPRQGFGLIEMMIVIAIVAILAAIALPSYRQLIKSNRVSTDTNDLVTALNLARNEAISRGRPVTVCASTNGTSCAAGSWASGWILFTDYGARGVVNSTSNDAVLRVWPAVTTQNTITGGPAFVSFARDGSPTFASGFTAAVSDVVFTIRPPNCATGDARQVKISRIGRLSSTSSDESSNSPVPCT